MEFADPDDDSSPLDDCEAESECVVKKMKTYKIFTIKENATKDTSDMYITLSAYDETDAILRYWEQNDNFRVIFKVEEADPLSFPKKNNPKTKKK